MRGARAFPSERIGGLFLVGVGLGGLYIASRLTFGDARQPGPGFYPVLVCVLLTVFGVLSLVGSTRPEAEEGAVSESGDGRIWMVVASMAVYTWALPKAGFVLCTIALLLLLLRGVGRVSWTGSATSAVIASIACYGALVKLGLPLPAGWLSF